MERQQLLTTSSVVIPADWATGNVSFEKKWIVTAVLLTPRTSPISEERPNARQSKRL